jgi:acyl-[acyl-carrier-protein]-phospholipid O-acyltransferase/long-chain-fatty-acid--[acyl-carrier-protein] ligase
MKGYLDNQVKTNEVIRIIDNQRYYITGDKGKIDNDGFLVLIDRYSRFVKIGGEMISLGAVEEKIDTIIDYDELDFIVTSIEDEKKGEKIVLLFSHNEIINIVNFKHTLIENFENKLMLPHAIHQVNQIPRLGTGKKDFKGAKDLAKSLSIK